MKCFTFFILAIILGGAVLAQTPQSFRYQAVARDNSGNILANQSVSFRISILSGSIAGTVVYSEIHTGLSTNTFGLVEMEIGNGTPVTGTFSSIDWGNNSYFVKIEMDPSGGTAFQVLSTSQLLSVPYALHAKTVETGDNWGTQVVVNDVTLTGNGTVAQPLTLADNAVTSSKISDGTITSADIGSNAVTSSRIADGTIAAADIASNAITTAKVASSAVTGEKIADGTITGAKIAQQSATSGQVLKWNGTIWSPAYDSSGPFVSMGGTTYNSFNLGDNFVIGSPSINDIEGTTDDNIRLYFNKSKGAFRAGEAYLSDWDEANTGDYSVAMGYKTKATGKYSSAFGSLNTAAGWYCTSMGYGTLANAINSVAIGKYNVGSGNPSSWVPEDPIFEIGIGAAQVERQNAMTVLKNGNVGIGPANPTAKLEVAGQVKITGGNPGSGKVLTSDAAGLATWETLPEGGLSLPYEGTGSFSDIAFSVRNDQMGINAIRGIAGSTSPWSNVAVEGINYGEAGLGISGIALSTSGITYGVRGEVNSILGFSGYFNGGKFYVSGNMGIGTSSPAALLHAEGTAAGQGNVVFIGEYKTSPGNPPVSGAGTRMMWYPDKAAFRAGHVIGTHWDAANIGNFSTAFGSSTTASGDYSLAAGANATALGRFSIACGYSNIASGEYSAAIGNGITASGRFSVGVGQSIMSTGIFSAAIGEGIEATSYCETVIGRYNSKYTPASATSWNASDRIFVIANGSSLVDRNNAITVLKSGNTGIGTDIPSAKLEVNGQIKITGGSPGAGKVLTSDATGLASWQSPAGSPFSSAGGITRNTPITDHLVFGSAFLDDAGGTTDDIRLFFNKTKGAFRAGRATGTEWNAASVGDYSAAFGDNNKASGSGSFASGVASVASGSTSTTMGYFVNATAMLSTAVGSYNVGSGNPTSWVSTDPIFEIGNGSTNVARSNAVTVLKNGNTGIGTFSPSQKLHIKGSAAGNAVVFIEPNIWNAAGDYGEIRFGDANHYIRGEHTNGMTFYDTDKFNFNGGNVGIGTANPGYKLDVSGNRIRLFEAGTNDWIALRTDGGSNDYLDFSWGGGSLVMQGATTNENIILNPSMNKVGIRTWSPMYDLDVTGNIRATGSVYYGGTAGSANGTAYIKPDYVFAEDYETMSVSEVEDFLKNKNHLPWVTSAKQEKHENGEATDMTRMAFETLESVENIQLQLIHQNRLISELKFENERLKSKNTYLESENKKVNDRLEKIEMLIGLSVEK